MVGIPAFLNLGFISKYRKLARQLFQIQQNELLFV